MGAGWWRVPSAAERCHGASYAARPLRDAGLTPRGRGAPRRVGAPHGLQRERRLRVCGTEGEGAAWRGGGAVGSLQTARPRSGEAGPLAAPCGTSRAILFFRSVAAPRC